MGLFIRSAFCIGIITALSPVQDSDGAARAGGSALSPQAIVAQAAKLCEADATLCAEAALTMAGGALNVQAAPLRERLRHGS